MSDYADHISLAGFKYSKPVYFTNDSGVTQSNVVARLTLTSSNFNFDLANEDGTDFCLVDGANPFHLWKAYWTKDARYAVLFFKLQHMVPGSNILYAYWGSDIVVPSSPEELGLIFYEDFNSTPLDSDKWSGDLNNTITEYGYLIGNFTTISGPLLGHNSWTMEAGIYGGFDHTANWRDDYRACGFDYTGTENPFVVELMHDDRIHTSASNPDNSTQESSQFDYGGLEGYSYNDLQVSYNEPEDRLDVKLSNRNSFPDVEHNISRHVEGDTRLEDVEILPREWSAYGTDGASPTYISWLVFREYDAEPFGALDGTELFIPYENVPHQDVDIKEYGIDITSVTYEHETDYGGNPYNLSNENYDSNDTVWVADPGAAVEDYVTATINLGWTNDQLVSRSYRHFDSDHVYYYNASKLSDLDQDVMYRNYWHGTTTSGWAAIKFPTSRRVGALRVQYNTDLGSGPKEFTFRGANVYSENFSDSVELTSGTFEVSPVWQSKKIPTSGKYKYFILDTPATQSGTNIKLQEWRMYDDSGVESKVYPSQLKLHPATYGTYQYNFPKEIQLEGTEDGVTWHVLIPWKKTYTPHTEFGTQGYWQHYSFDNEIGVWSLRLKCRGNWGGGDNRIIIGQWSIHELKSEADTHRVLNGSNNIQQIWASEGTTFDDTSKIVYIANDKLNIVADGKLKEVKDLPVDYDDFNVV